jgi:bacillithiol system protein YtxJ
MKFLVSDAALEAALLASQQRPVLLFKHSATCGISAQAHESLSEWIAGQSDPPPVYVIEVRTHRPLSMAVAERFGIRHESPQVLLVDRGAVVWHASHFHVNAREVAAALAARAQAAV